LEAVEADGDVVEIEDRAVGEVELAGGDARPARLAAARAAGSSGGALGGGARVGAGAHQVGRHRALPASRRVARSSRARTPSLPRTRPTIPCGRKSVTAMNIAPSTYSHASGSAWVNQLFAPLTKKAPTIGPTSVARPPTAVQIAIS